MRVSLIGSGNVATVLGRRILQSGHVINEVLSRNKLRAASLADELSAVAVDTFNGGADMYIVAVSDDALLSVDTWLARCDGMVVHTAGSVSMEVLSGISDAYGVLWPLQSIRSETAGMPVLPVVIDANNPWNKIKLKGFAQSFADSVAEADDEQRAKLHLAAVVANNFSNHLFSVTSQFCEDEGVDFNLLLPLLAETVTRMAEYSPGDLQTGPAVRNDVSTIEKHRALLNEHASLLEIYDFFTEKIRRES